MGHIKVQSTFDGTATFGGFGRLNNDKKTPFILVHCADEETGDIADAKLFCSEKALKHTVKKLWALGVPGDSEQEVISNAKVLVDAPCTFDTVENDGYYNADNLRGRGEAASSGVVADLDEADFMAAVFGASPAVADKPKKAVKKQHCPF